MNTRRFRFGLTMSGMALASAGLLAACGSSGAAGQGSSGGGSGGATIKTRDSGLGALLTDGSGKTLYSPEQEANGKISCTDACVGFWYPVLSSSAKVSSKASLPGKLGTVKRPDTGKMQVTYDGLPLYTFKLDSGPGDTKGNDFSDKFGSKKFTWYAITTKGSTEDDSSSNPSSSSSSGGGYNY